MTSVSVPMPTSPGWRAGDAGVSLRQRARAARARRSEAAGGAGVPALPVVPALPDVPTCPRRRTRHRRRCLPCRRRPRRPSRSRRSRSTRGQCQNSQSGHDAHLPPHHSTPVAGAADRSRPADGLTALRGLDIAAARVRSEGRGTGRTTGGNYDRRCWIETSGVLRRVFCGGRRVAGGGAGRGAGAHARVPERYATIQAAVDAADAGDVIDVSPGRHCGATIDRPVRLDGNGRAVIVGCADGPALAGGVRAGFRLAGGGRRQRRQRHADRRFRVRRAGRVGGQPRAAGSGDHRRVRERRARRAQPHHRHRPGDHQHRRRSLG